MGYKVTIEIEPGSAEDRLLHSEGDPAAFLQKLVSRESTEQGLSQDSAMLVSRLLELEPFFRQASENSDAELSQRQAIALAIQREELPADR